MHPSEYERLQHEIMAYIVGVPPNLQVMAREILMVYNQIQNQLKKYAEEARIGLELAVKETIAEGMTHGKLPINVDTHAAKGVLQQAKNQLSNNISRHLTVNAAPEKKADEPKFRPGL